MSERPGGRRDGGAQPVMESLEFLGDYHVVAIHFPIALLLAAGLAEVIDRVVRRGLLSVTSLYCLMLGAAGAVLAMAFGWIEHEEYLPMPGMEETFEHHETLGYWTAGIAVLAVILRLRSDAAGDRPGPRRLYLFGLLAAVALLVVTAWHGGQLNHP